MCREQAPGFVLYCLAYGLGILSSFLWYGYKESALLFTRVHGPLGDLNGASYESERRSISFRGFLSSFFCLGFAVMRWMGWAGLD